MVAKCQRLCDYLSGQGAHRSVDIEDACMRLVLDAVGQVSFDLDFDSLSFEPRTMMEVKSREKGVW
jgi:hypothetical protein